MSLPQTGILPLGITPGIEISGGDGRQAVSPGDRLYLLSDGITEATDASGEMFGIDRLARFLASQARTAPLDALVPLLREFRGTDGFDDDITLAEIAF